MIAPEERSITVTNALDTRENTINTGATTTASRSALSIARFFGTTSPITTWQ